MTASGPISLSLAENVRFLQDTFGTSTDFYSKPLNIGGIDCRIVLFTGLSSPEKLTVMMLSILSQEREAFADGPALARHLLRESLIPTESAPITTREEMIERLANGLTLLLIEGCPVAVTVSSQEMPQRSVSEPDGEGNMYGPQEAFTEQLRTNISLLRRQFRTGTLVVERHDAHNHARTEYCLCYDRARAPADTVDTLRRKLDAAHLPVLLDSSYFASFLKQDKLNLFPAAAYTVRPATACARLCEGKVVILVAGSPCAMVIPSFFAEHFECLDDYSSGAVFAWH